jgi:subtilisin family serine protease
MEATSPDYYYMNGKRFPLVVEPTVYAVKFKPGERLASTSLTTSSRRLLRDKSQNVEFISNYGIQVYEIQQPDQLAADPAGATKVKEDALRAVRSLHTEEPVEFATPAFRQTPDSPDLMFITNRFVAQFKPGVSRQQIDELNQKNNVRIVEALDFVENGYLLESLNANENMSAVRLANIYYESGLTVFSHPDFIKRRHWKGAANREPLRAQPAPVVERSDFLSQQWHLTKAKVVDAWAITRGAPTINVAILDDGVDVEHAEFKSKITRQFDFAANIEDATPKSPSDKHGTACAGVAVAGGVKAFGAAPGCGLIAARTPEYLGTVDEAKMFKWAADNGADVISCSWGPADGTGSNDPLPDTTRAAIRGCIVNGRKGKGISIFWAAGNGNESVSLDGYAANPDVIAIAASTSKDTKAWYSDSGPEIWVCAPSSGNASAGETSIFTTDRRGTQGYNSGTASKGDSAGDYTNDFGGTSSAAPLAAGIAGLILSVNPELTSNQLRDILKKTAEKIGSGYDANGHSAVFGFGRINALAAVRAAQAGASGGQTGGGQTDGGQTGGGVQTPSETGIKIKGPATWSRSDAPPTFQINPSPNPFYVVEVTARPDLFNRLQHGQERTPDNFYGSWMDVAFLSSPNYTLPAGAWDRLKKSDRLYYRLFTSAKNSAWVNFTVTVTDENVQAAPFIKIADEESAIVFPSGAKFTATQKPLDGIDYNDPVAGNAVPLIEVAGRGEEKLSPDILVKQLAADGARYARISPDLVIALQKLRDKLKVAVNIHSGYRYIALNKLLGGDAFSAHLSGCAADISSDALDQTQLAQSAIKELGPKIAISLGNQCVHIDVRGAEKGCSKTKTASAEESKSTNKNIDAIGPVIVDRKSEAPALPAIIGPHAYELSLEPPAFLALPGSNRFCAIEVATEYRLFDRRLHGSRRQPNNFYGSWQQGLKQTNGPAVITLPEEIWRQMQSSAGLFYRIITCSSDAPGWPDYQTSTPDERAAEAPWIKLIGNGIARRSRFPAKTTARSYDESLWRSQ